MSRGLGKLQREILDHLAANPGAATYESLRWSLLELTHAESGRFAGAKARRLRNGRMPAAWNSSLTRALTGLGEHGGRRLMIERRRLASMQEFVHHYPGKTLFARTRELRLALLPWLKKIAEADGHAVRLSHAENERWFIEKNPGDKLVNSRAKWSSIEPELVAHVPRLSRENRNHLFLLIARGKSLFEGAPLDCQRSIDQCLAPLAQQRALPDAILQRVCRFSESLFPSDEIGFLRLKSLVGSLTHIPARGRQYRLKDETVEALERLCRDTLEKVFPGFKPWAPKTTRSLVLRAGPRSNLGPEIHSLIDNTVFTKFVFVRLA
jgi:hypothetical protein